MAESHGRRGRTVPYRLFFSPQSITKVFIFFYLECDFFLPALTHEVIVPRAVLPRVCSSASLLTLSPYPYSRVCRTAAFPQMWLQLPSHPGRSKPMG